MNKTVFIASLSHSGSTLFDMILGGHSKFIGLGELALVSRNIQTKAKDIRTNQCSCGAPAHECSFWGDALSEIDRLEQLDQTRIYEVIYRNFAEKYGPEYTIIDSSKYIHALNFSHQFCADNLQALHLLKDVRPFTVSQIDNAQRKNRGRAFFPQKYFRKWYSGNRAIERCLDSLGMEPLTVGYEDLCLYSERTLHRICRFLGVEYEPAMLELSQSKSHSIVGNRMRKQAEKRVLRYDNRWFTRKEWALPALLNPHITKYNTEKVYSSEALGMWHK